MRFTPFYGTENRDFMIREFTASTTSWLCCTGLSDRTKCKGGGVALYYAEHLTAVHRKDLLVRDIEAVWIQVKFPAHTTLFSVVYRSELETPNFFENFHGVLEKAWLKTDSIFVLGDLNCCMLEAQNIPGSTLITSKTKNLLRLFEDFNMQNVIAEPTRITIVIRGDWL